MSGPSLPWPADRRPLSVVVFGNSVASWVMPVGTESAEADGPTNYLAVLSDRLAAAGMPVQPHMESRWFDFLHRAIRDFEQRVRNHNPDVVIVHFGINEMQPWIVPVWLIRHLLVRGWAVTRTARTYRERVAAPAWRQVRRFRRWASPYVGTRSWQTTPARFAGHLQVLIRMTRMQLRPLVLVIDINEVGDVVEHFLPGMTERHAIFQQAISDVVTSFDSDDVRLVECSRICAAIGPEAMPDGQHMSREAHTAVGEVLADEVKAWLSRRGG